MHCISHTAFLKVALLLLLNICLLRRDSISNAAKDVPEPRIVGGVVNRISNLPYLVNLRRGRTGQFFCGGTMVTRSHIVTAAHCVDGLRPRDLLVVAGAQTLTTNGIQSRVTKIMMPRGWSSRTVNNDIAVLKLRHPIRGQNTSPIAICNHKMQPGDRVKVSGWGIKNEQTGQLSHQVRSVQVPILSRKKCSGKYRGIAQITRSMMCAGIPGRKDSCRADSGGPLVSRGRLCGIVSWGVGCGRPDSPGVYTNVNALRGFLRQALRR